MILTDQFYRMAFVGLAIGCLLFLLFKVSPRKVFVGSVVYIYIAIILGITLFPLPFAAPGWYPAANNYIPFASIIEILQSDSPKNAVLQIGGNILLFVPYGVLIFLLCKKEQKKRPFLLLLLFPMVIELLQWIIGIIIGVNYRSFDVDDILLNLTGGIIGYILSAVFLSKLKDKLISKINA